MARKSKGKHRQQVAHAEKAIQELLKSEKLKSFNYKQVAAAMGIEDEIEREIIQEALESMASRQLIEESRPGKYRYLHRSNHVEGKVDLTTKGSAYVIVDGQDDDIYITPRNVGHALQGDRVRVLLYARRKNKKPEGEIVEILQRARTEFVGTVEMSKNYGFLVPDSRKMLVDLYIPKEHLKGAQDGQKAIARITEWPDHASSPFGEIIEVLGEPGEHDVEIHSILADYGLPRSFPEALEEEAARIPEQITEAEIKKRRDFRAVTTFTIDPEDAKDFDDALSIRKLDQGHYEIGVHIADVTHYVKEGTAMEEEALARATSVYLVDRVVPMLPEKLSNQVCSLRPHEEKLTFSAVFEMNDKAEVVQRWFGRTVIYSDRRFTYQQAQEVLESGQGDLAEEIGIFHRLATHLRKARMQNGALAFERDEVKFELNEKAEPVGVYFKRSQEANHLIEEFMLLANREVAEFIGKARDGKPSGKTFIYRIHDKPDGSKLQDLATFVKQFGYNVKTEGARHISQSLNQMLAKVRGTGYANLIETLTIRTMAKAVYSTKNIGHYGLAFSYYSHFTSPIRRYPDMMVHRLLQHYLDGKNAPTAALYEEHCKHASNREKLASDAERDSIKFMQAKYLSDKVGQEFHAIISGVTEWGVFVELVETKCEGMIRIRDFDDDFYTFDERSHSIEGERKGKVFQLGDAIMVKLKGVDLEKKQIDFLPL